MKLMLLVAAASSYAQGPNDSGDYYQNADGKKGAVLKTALCGIVYNRDEGGDLNTAYKALWTHFQTTDARADGKVWDMYSNKRAMTFGETSNPTYKSANDFSKLGPCSYPGYTGTVFEPIDEYKGDFARTYFYMVTCYEEKLADWYASNPESQPTLDGQTYPGLSSWQLAMLMKWAKNDPVSEKEINRNNAVYAIQKNRNPFIDYPNWSVSCGAT